MPKSNPILYDIPMPIITSRLMIRPYQENDTTAIADALLESADELKQWMPWAQNINTDSIHDFELLCIRSFMAKWMLREELNMLIVDKNRAQIMGTIGLKSIDWSVPKMEIGYWLRTSMTGKGIMTEAVNALTHYGFKQLNAKRIEIRCDEANIKSRAIPKRLNFSEEGILRNNDLTADGTLLRNTVIYACYDISDLPDLNVTW